jgi:hypothetical protein
MENYLINNNYNHNNNKIEEINIINKKNILPSFTDKIKDSCLYVKNFAKSVKINQENLTEFIEKLDLNYFSKEEFLNYFNNHLSNIKDKNSIKYEDLIAYVCVVDSLNFCFWPLENNYKDKNIEFEYDDYVKNLNKIFEENKEFFTCDYLMNLKINELKEKVFSNLDFPLLEERLRSLNELGYYIKFSHNESFENFLEFCEYDCEKVFKILYNYIYYLVFYNFLFKKKIAEEISKGVSTYRDTSLFRGKQIFIYKRAQILAADLSTAIKCLKNPNKILLKNVEKLTMFADYRIPQILRHYGIIEYNEKLAEKIDCKEEIEPNSIEEVFGFISINYNIILFYIINID